MALQAISRLMQSLWGTMKLIFILGVFLLMAPLTPQAGEPAQRQDGRYRNQVQLPRTG